MCDLVISKIKNITLIPKHGFNRVEIFKNEAGFIELDDNEIVVRPYFINMITPLSFILHYKNFKDGIKLAKMFYDCLNKKEIGFIEETIKYASKVPRTIFDMGCYKE